MLSTLHNRLHDDEDGFTLIELMVVVLIIAILIAIAIPTFLGVQNRARDRAAQSDLRNALTAAKTLATDNAGYFLDNSATPVAIDSADLIAAEGSLSFDVIANASTSKIGILVPSDGSSIVLEKVSASGTAFSVAANKDGAVTYCKSAGTGATAKADCDTLTETTATKW
ncbi:MAG: prepilin-type N-terminal cleavage/methylation protein [Actinomycetia bacterium]|nr:prepilin-type N-terminal cleavage/methylation protein [Actinomycetes bacterium]